MKKVGIYAIKNLKNNKIYIGQSINIQKRIIQHKSNLKRNKHPNAHLQASYNYYGENNFEFYILELCEKDVLDKREKYWIDFFDGKNCQNNFNEKDGGKTHFELSDEAKKKCGFCNLGKHRSPKNEFKKGGHPGKEFQKGLVPYNRKMVYQYDLEGKFINNYNSLKEAAQKNKISSSLLSLCCNKKIKTAKGYQWRFKDENPANKIVKINCVAVYQYDLDGNFIQKFNNIKSAADYIGVKPSVISQCLSGKSHSSKGYQWKREYQNAICKAKTNKKIIQQFSANGILLKEYKSTKSLNREFSSNSSSNIIKSIKSKKLAYGYYWKYKI
jgi:group I intron endonuclease